MLHLVVTLFNATQQSINQQLVRCWEENILKNELAFGFWRKSNRFVKVVYPSASESGLFRLFLLAGARFLGRFWRESRLFVTTPVFSLPQVIFDFFYPYFGIRSSTVIAMENGINNPFVGSMWFLKTEELIFRQSIGIRAIWYCFPRPVSNPQTECINSKRFNTVPSR